MFVLTVVITVIYVAAGILGTRPGNEVARQTPTPTAPWPTTIHTKTPTPTSIPTATPEPTYTPTSTPTSTPTLTPTPTPTPIVVINHIEVLGRLETVQYVAQTVVDLEKEPSNIWQRVFGTDKLLLIAEGEVVAGFDLSKVEESDVVVRGTAVSLTLPSPEILHSWLDDDRTFVYERETGIVPNVTFVKVVGVTWPPASAQDDTGRPAPHRPSPH